MENRNNRNSGSIEDINLINNKQENDDKGTLCIVYKIYSPITKTCYIGSSNIGEKARLQRHEGAYRSYLHGHRKYYSLFDIMETGMYEIRTLEIFMMYDKNDKRKKEQEWLDKTFNAVNRHRALKKKE